MSVYSMQIMFFFSSDCPGMWWLPFLLLFFTSLFIIFYDMKVRYISTLS